jgi:PhnB protein
MAVKAKPDAYRTLTPFFQVQEADRFIEFMKTVFGAQETEMMRRPDGTVAHAEFRIGDSMVMLGQSETMPLALYVYLDDVDGVFRKGLEAGGASEQDPVDQPWGDRQASVKDPWGNLWFIATHKEDVSMEELERRMAAAAPQG